MSVHSGGNILNIGYCEDSQASETKLFSRVKETDCLLLLLLKNAVLALLNEKYDDDMLGMEKEKDSNEET